MFCFFLGFWVVLMSKDFWWSRISGNSRSLPFPGMDASRSQIREWILKFLSHPIFLGCLWPRILLHIFLPKNWALCTYIIFQLRCQVSGSWAQDVAAPGLWPPNMLFGLTCGPRLSGSWREGASPCLSLSFLHSTCLCLSWNLRSTQPGICIMEMCWFLSDVCLSGSDMKPIWCEEVEEAVDTGRQWYLWWT